MLAAELGATCPRPNRSRRSRSVCATALPAVELLQRRALLSGAVLLLSGSGPAVHARGIDRYIRGAKQPEPEGTQVALVLLAQEELAQFVKVLRTDGASLDPADVRSLLRAGPFRNFRSALRLAVPLGTPGRDAAEACFRKLEEADVALIALAKADSPEKRVLAAASLAAAEELLASAVAGVPPATLEAARALLQ